ncbi:MAG: hypothetical protein M1822_005965 [Bathelium mastoideum]|nr:MAG: hypothetical protein M1822_005965 [Bathelium mastoideum]
MDLLVPRDSYSSPRDFSINYCQERTCYPFLYWQANPDIAGVGVLIAFALTSIVTFLAIIVGYLFNAVRDDGGDGLLNCLDYWVVESLLRCKRLNGHANQRKRRDALERFVLALSDQQIVTGLAISMIGYIQHCSLSSYHFFVIVALVWFSSTTHLSTLALLQQYLKGHPMLMFVRLAGMFALFVMLFMGLLIIYVNEVFQVPVQCRFQKLGSRELYKVPLLNHIVAVSLFAFLTTSYLVKFIKLLRPNRNAPIVNSPLIIPRKISESKKRLEQSQRRLGHVSNNSRLELWRQLKRGFIVFQLIYLEFLDSFLWQILWLYFGNFYGIRQLFWARVFVPHSANIQLWPNGDENRLGFGQLLALLLLALPLLAAIEARYDAKRTSYLEQWGTGTQAVTGASGDQDSSQRSAQLELVDDHQEPQTFTQGSSEHQYLIERAIVSPELPSSIAVPVFIGLFAYTFTTLTLVAWYIAYSFEGHKAGVVTSLVMAAILTIPALLIRGDELLRIFWDRVAGH